MKIKLTKYFVLAALLVLASPSMATANLDAVITESREAKAIELIKRLEEIKAIDNRQLSAKEKKALHREVRQIKKELAAASGGVYLSVGAILLIALLLILLL